VVQQKILLSATNFYQLKRAGLNHEQEAKMKIEKAPIKLNLTIEQASLARIVEKGRLMEFVDALSSQASALI
jgi:hypothetical protein